MILTKQDRNSLGAILKAMVVCNEDGNCPQLHVDAHDAMWAAIWPMLNEEQRDQLEKYGAIAAIEYL